MDMFLRNFEAAQAQARSAVMTAQESARGFAHSVSEHGKVLAGNLTENTKVLAEQVCKAVAPPAVPWVVKLVASQVHNHHASTALLLCNSGSSPTCCTKSNFLATTYTVCDTSKL